MRRSILAILSMAICLLFTSELVMAHKAGKQADSKLTKHFNRSLFKITEKGSFSVEILMDEKEYKIGKNAVGLVVHDDHDDDVEGADIKITAQTADGMVIKDSASIREKGEGLYIVKNLDLKRSGQWELKIREPLAKVSILSP